MTTKMFVLAAVIAAFSAVAQAQYNPIPYYGSSNYGMSPYYNGGYYGSYPIIYGGGTKDAKSSRIKEAGKAAPKHAESYTGCVAKTLKEFKKAKVTVDANSVMDRCMLVSDPGEPGSQQGTDRVKTTLADNLRRK